MIEFKIFKTSNELPKEWDPLVSHDLFLQAKYLGALEKAAPDNISHFFVGFYHQNRLVGVAIIQRVQLYLNDIFRNQDDTCFRERFKNTISKILRGNILVVGNLTHTGQHGLFFDLKTISYNEFLEPLFEALKALKNDIKKSHNKKIRAYLMKDYFLDNPIIDSSEYLNSSGFYKLTVQPNMIMKIEKHWKSFEDYIADLQKKYRDRYKSARKKAKQIVKRELNTSEVEETSELLYILYKNVSDHAKINTFILPRNHFSEFKKQLGSSFKVYGYYLENELVGFYTLILNSNQLETYFLGYNPLYQHKHQLYLNMLYDMAKFGIEHNFETIVYARTAMEIKSSVGAKPEHMVMYLKHTNWLLNALLKAIFRLMNPAQVWQERHPFK